MRQLQLTRYKRGIFQGGFSQGNQLIARADMIPPVPFLFGRLVELFEYAVQSFPGNMINHNDPQKPRFLFRLIMFSLIIFVGKVNLSNHFSGKSFSGEGYHFPIIFVGAVVS